MPWHVYILKCKDGKLYTGITNNLSRRIKAHNSGNGCRYTKYRAPVKLLYSEEVPDKPAALISNRGRRFSYIGIRDQSQVEKDQ